MDEDEKEALAREAELRYNRPAPPVGAVLVEVLERLDAVVVERDALHTDAKAFADRALQVAEEQHRVNEAAVKAAQRLSDEVVRLRARVAELEAAWPRCPREDCGPYTSRGLQCPECPGPVPGKEGA